MTLTKDNITGQLKISGTLDMVTANTLREALLECFLLEPEVVADLSAVDGCDAAALQVLLAGHKDAASFGKPFRMNAASPAVLETAEALGLSIGLPVDPAREDT
jgi:anti-anti-sigma factor